MLRCTVGSASAAGLGQNEPSKRVRCGGSFRRNRPWYPHRHEHTTTIPSRRPNDTRQHAPTACGRSTCHCLRRVTGLRSKPPCPKMALQKGATQIIVDVGGVVGAARSRAFRGYPWGSLSFQADDLPALKGEHSRSPDGGTPSTTRPATARRWRACCRGSFPPRGVSGWLMPLPPGRPGSAIDRAGVILGRHFRVPLVRVQPAARPATGCTKPGWRAAVHGFWTFCQGPSCDGRVRPAQSSL
jgi:hypothetical protein